MFEELLLRVVGPKSDLVARADLPDLDLREREHLQEWVLSHPEILGDGVKVITSEFDRWQGATGEAIKDRLDILGLAPDGRLVVAELKRGQAPHTIQMQALNYAAMVSRMTPTDIAEIHADYLSRSGVRRDPGSILDELTTALLLSEEGIRNPRIVLIASSFPPSVSATAVWLIERNIDISLIRFIPYQVDNEIVVSFSRFLPVPSVEDFTIARRAAPAEVPSDDGEPWDEPGLRLLISKGNPATLALIDLCAVDSADPVGVADVASHAGLRKGQIRGQLAGFTMMLRNPAHGFRQKAWPISITWLPGGVSSYTMPGDLAALWRTLREDEPTAPATDHL